MADSTAPLPKGSSASGEFHRPESQFRKWVRRDGESEFPAAAGRYRLYVSYACPWAHRTILFRKLKRLEGAISLGVVDPVRDERGWAFRDGRGHGTDDVEGFRYLSEAYRATDPKHHDRGTVPVLWDTERRTVVNNESSDIIRMLNSEFDACGAAEVDFYPEPLRAEIERINEKVYRCINNGVYRAGFATLQPAYEEAFNALFRTLDELEQLLSAQRFLVGDRLTEADWRLFTTLVRFDPVYHGHFKCNLKRLIDYPQLWSYLRELYQHPGVAETVNMDHIKRHYYVTHIRINPTGIVPTGPWIDFMQPHDRERFAKE